MATTSRALLRYPTTTDAFQPERDIQNLAEDVDSYLSTKLPREVFADGTYGVLAGSFTSGTLVRDWTFYNVGSSAIPFASGGIFGLLTPFTGGVVAATVDFIGGPDDTGSDAQLPTKWTVYNTGTGTGGQIIVNFRAWLANGTNPSGYSRRWVARVTGW